MRFCFALAFTSLLGSSNGQFISDECSSTAALFLECYSANTEACAQSCSAVLGLLGQEPTCDKVPEYCTGLSCCAPCLALGVDTINCQSKVLSCSDTCSETSPMPQSPDSPTTPPSTADTPMPVISPTSSPSSIATDSEVCAQEASDFYACFTENISSCNSTCNEAGLGASTDIDCDYVKAALEVYGSCCKSCSDLGKALVKCESDSRSCDIFDTVAPSPAVTDGENEDVTSAAPTPRKEMSRASTEFYLSRTLISVLLFHVVWQTLSV